MLRKDRLEDTDVSVTPPGPNGTLHLVQVHNEPAMPAQRRCLDVPPTSIHAAPGLELALWFPGIRDMHSSGGLTGFPAYQLDLCEPTCL